jgi:TetR/AcrR family transcriptional regulator, fatty acid metabolism regulator protein
MPSGSKARANTGTDTGRRRTILRAAIEVFARKGYHGARMADVAREAGVAYGLVYHYFQSKEALLESVFEVSWSGFAARVREAAQATGTLADKIRGVLGVGFDAYRVDSKGVRVVLLEIARAPASSRLNRESAFGDLSRIGAEMFQEALDRGQLRNGTDPLLCAALLIGALESLLTAILLGLVDAHDEAALERAKQQCTEVFLNGVLSEAASGVRASR